MFKKGDLVRVRANAVRPFGTNAEWFEEHGWLWIITRKDSTGDWECKSLATGKHQDHNGDPFWFYESELEVCLT